MRYSNSRWAHKGRKAYKRLFKELKKDAFGQELKGVNIKLIVSLTRNSPCYAKSSLKAGKLTYTVKINLTKLYNYTVIRGYSNDYYPARSEKLASLKHNRKKMLQFTILHELVHIMEHHKNIKFNYNSLGFDAERERSADDYAINYINNKLGA